MALAQLPRQYGRGPHQVFEGIDLCDSFVLGWRREGSSLLFDMEAGIWPASDYYTKPKNDEYTCYRKATLEFAGVIEVFGLNDANATPSTTDPKAFQTDEIAVSHLLQKTQKLRHSNFAAGQRRYATEAGLAKRLLKIAEKQAHLEFGIDQAEQGKCDDRTRSR